MIIFNIFFLFFQMSAIDPDCGVNAIVNYTLGDGVSQQFSVRADTGDLCVSGPLDHESNSDFEFPVIATDRGNTFFKYIYCLKLKSFICYLFKFYCAVYVLFYLSSQQLSYVINSPLHGTGNCKQSKCSIIHLYS